MPDIHSLDALNLIKLLCIKQDRLDHTAWWRPIKKMHLRNDRDEIITTFLNKCDVFEQANAICGILQGFGDEINRFIINGVMNYISVGRTEVKFNLVKGYDHVTRTGTITYNEINNEFTVDIDPIPMEENGYSFIYKSNSALSNKFKTLWDRDIMEPLEVIFMDALLCIVHIVNSPVYAFEE